MRKTFIYLLVLLTAQLSLAQTPDSPITINGNVVYANSLNARITQIMAQIGMPGLSLAIIDSSKILFYNTYGYKSIDSSTKDRVDSATIFEGCSMSKSFVVFAAYKLVDAGKLNLDKPLYKYLRYRDLEHDNRYKLITARMVMSHVSGIENHKDQNNPLLLEIISPPGKAFVYSGEGYIYLSKVIEKLTSKPVETFLQDMVYKPLGLNRTFTTYTGGANIDHASAHDALGDVFVKEKNLYPDIAGRIHTNAHEYATLLVAIVDGKHLSDSIFKTISTPLVQIGERAGLYYGAGFEILITPDKDTMIIQGGDNNGYKGMGCYSIVHKVGFVFYGNSERSESVGLELCRITTGLDISLYYDDIYHNAYPNCANYFFHLYREKGAEAVKAKFDAIMDGQDTLTITGKDLLDIVYNLKLKDYDSAKYIAMKYLVEHPSFSEQTLLQKWFKN